MWSRDNNSPWCEEGGGGEEGWGGSCQHGLVLPALVGGYLGTLRTGEHVHK
jgi:hypothetical protein